MVPYRSRNFPARSPAISLVNVRPPACPLQGGKTQDGEGGRAAGISIRLALLARWLLRLKENESELITSPPARSRAITCEAVEPGSSSTVSSLAFLRVETCKQPY